MLLGISGVAGMRHLGMPKGIRSVSASVVIRPNPGLWRGVGDGRAGDYPYRYVGGKLLGS
jgi:hypothetical protein